jgi:membrane protein
VVVQEALVVERRLFGRAGWLRVVRNSIVGFVTQAGTRMAAALSYYALLAAGPMLVLTLWVGGTILGEQTIRQIVAAALPRLLPPSALIATELAEAAVQHSHTTTWLALVTGLASLVGFARALSTSLNVTLNESGAEPIHRTAKLAPLLYLAVIGLLWGSWSVEVLVSLAEESAMLRVVPRPGLLLGNVAPFCLVIVHFTIILSIVPRARLTLTEVIVPSVVGAILWEAARNAFGWLIGTDSFYLQLFGPLGAVVALLGWIYLSSAVLVLTGQFAWAFAMERRGRGLLARHAPRRAGLNGLTDPFEVDNAVNEVHHA